jgi:hypothetical protein
VRDRVTSTYPPIVRVRNEARAAKARARSRKCYRLTTRNEAVYHVACGPDVVEMLIALGWLQDGHAGDRQKVSRAIAELLTDTAAKIF